MSAATCPAWCTDHQKPDHPEDERHRTTREVPNEYAGYEIVDYVLNSEGPHLFFWGSGDDPVVAEELAELLSDALGQLRSIRSPKALA